MSFRFLDFESSFFTDEELLFLAGASGGKLVEETATGNPVSFETDVAKPLKVLSIPFLPVQSGSGDPSPDNVRPITGWTGVNIYRSGEDTSNPLTIPISWQTEAGTVYGGTLDALTGVLTVECACENVTGNISVNGTLPYGGAQIKWIPTSAKKYASDGSHLNDGLYCNTFKSSATSMGDEYCVTGRITSGNVFFNMPQEVTNLQEASTWFNNNPTQVAYLLATPVTYQLDPVTLSTLIGENVIWTDTNGDNTITYLKRT